MFKPQGTAAYITHMDNTGRVNLVDLGCITSIGGVGMSASMRDRTALGDEFTKQEPGIFSAGTVEISTLLDVGPDTPTEVISDIFERRQKSEFIIGLSDSDSEPYIVDGRIEPEYGRTWIKFEGYVQDWSTEMQLDAMVPLTVSYQPTDKPDIIYYMEVPWLEETPWVNEILWR